MRLSVLDQSPVPEGAGGSDGLRSSIELAIECERLGYHRFWVAEHHGTPSLACTSPEVLIAEIASRTSRIRVGSGGVMLPHYSPFKVAELFSTLEALHPGRIDLGLGRAAGTDPRTALALQRDRSRPRPDDFPSQLAELLGYLEGSLPAEFPFAHLSRWLPGAPDPPEPWLLGSSEESALWAAEAGLPYAFADFINPLPGPEAVRTYRERFQPSRWASEPRVIAAVWVTCAETDEEAKRLSSSARVVFRELFAGRLIQVPPVEKALSMLDAASDRPRLKRGSRRRRNVVGSPGTVAAMLEEVESDYAPDEMMIVSMMFDPRDRIRSYELLSSELSPSFSLAG